MILWTIQDERIFEQMKKTGTVRANRNHICDVSFKNAYQWMIDQMKVRIGNPPEEESYPVWAWYRWEGKRKRPDMRSFGRNSSEVGKQVVLLTLDVPEEKVLLSDFDLWHCVLMNRELVFSDNECMIYSEEEKRKSWENIFDIEGTYTDDLMEKEALSTQATLWEIKREWVKKVEHFIMR